MNQETSPRLQVSGLLTLPTELVDEICKYLVGYQSLTALCQSSKKLYQIFLPFLYRFIEIGSGQLLSLARTLFRRPDIAKMVHTFVLDIPSTHESLSSGHGVKLGAICRSRYNRPWEPSYVVDLIPPVLHQIRNLRDLRIHTHEELGFIGPSPTLNHLGELTLSCGGVNHFRVREQLQWLLRGAPNLRSIDLDGTFINNAPDTQRGYSNITELALGNNQCKRCRKHYMFDMLAAFPNLKSFTFAVPSMCNNPDSLNKTLMTALEPHQENLQSLRLYPTDPLCLYGLHHVASLKDFINLQHLSIATRFIIMKKPPFKMTKLFQNMPQSIRTLNVLLEDRAVIRSLFNLATARENGSYPNLEKLTLGIPEYLTLKPSRGWGPRLAQACDAAGIELVVAPVCGPVPDDIELGCACVEEFEDWDWDYEVNFTDSDEHFTATDGGNDGE